MGPPGKRWRGVEPITIPVWEDRDWLRSSAYLGDKLHCLHFGEVGQLFDQQAADDCPLFFSNFCDLEPESLKLINHGG